VLQALPFNLALVRTGRQRRVISTVGAGPPHSSTLDVTGQEMNVEARYLWIQVCEVLKWHNKGKDACIDTLNRLWRKHPEVKGVNGEVFLDVPALSEEVLTVYAEQWPLDRLVALKRSHVRDRPLFFPPIIILRWFDHDFLIDGTTRINLWEKAGNVGPHAVLRITERTR